MLTTIDRPYQIAGIDFLCATPRALLADDTRLGKSRQALRAAARLDLQRILICTPNIGLLSWPQEITKHAPELTRHIQIIPYDTLSDSSEKARQRRKSLRQAQPRWDVLILDEAHYLKSDGSNRTKAVYGGDRVKGLIENVDRVWLLTATPSPNHAGELYPHYRALWPDAITALDDNALPRALTQDEFENRFCNVDHTIYGKRIAGSRDQGTLRGLLSKYVLRRTKREVIQNLPPVTYMLAPLQVQAASMPSPSSVANLSDNVLMDILERETPGIATLRRELGEAKVQAASDWIMDTLMSGVAKLVVFAWHHQVLHRLFDQLQAHEPAYIDGATPPLSRQAMVDRFQTNPRCRVFIGQTLAAGTAICLDAADEVAIVEPSWVPAENYQAACRIENVASRKSVTVSWLYAPNTLDERIMRVCERKTREIAKLWE